MTMTIPATHRLAALLPGARRPPRASLDRAGAADPQKRSRPPVGRAAIACLAPILALLIGCAQDILGPSPATPDGPDAALDASPPDLDASAPDVDPIDSGRDPADVDLGDEEDAVGLEDASMEDAVGSEDAGSEDAVGLEDAVDDVDPSEGDAALADVGPDPPDAAIEDVDPEPPPRCPPLPVACAAVEPSTAVEHHMEALDGCAFGLVRVDDPGEGRRIMDEIAPLSGGIKSLREVLDNLNRQGTPGITAQSADRLRNHPHLGFRWNDRDMATTDWYPQGITGGSDRQSDGRPLGRRLLLVSWYDHREVLPAKGVRLALVDLTDPQRPAYRLILLVTPARANGAATIGPVVVGDGSALHAGGIAWIGDLLYVADTSEGFRVFDMARIVEADVSGDDRIGVVDGRIYAYGYRYIVPQIARYRLAPGACPARFSFAGLDRDAAPARLVSGEYRSGDPLGRVISWPVDLDGGWLIEERGVVRAISAAVGAQTRMQGAVSVRGDTYISSSSQAGSFGRLYRTRPGIESSVSAWVYGAEDLYYERDTDRIWTAAEHPGARDTVSIIRLDP